MQPPAPDSASPGNDRAKVKVDAAEVLKAVSAAMEDYFRGDGEFLLDLEDVKLRIYLEPVPKRGLFGMALGFCSNEHVSNFNPAKLGAVE